MTDGERIMAIAKIAYRSNEVNQEIWRLFKKYVDKNGLYMNYVTGCGCPNDISHRWRELIDHCLNNPEQYNQDDSPDIVAESIPNKKSTIIKK